MHQAIWIWLRDCWLSTWCQKIYFRRGFLKIVAEFLTEVAVLVLVFPYLDTVIQKGQSNVTSGLVVGSVIVAVGCLLIAGFISFFASKSEEEERE
jgi:hypothetical protein